MIWQDVAIMVIQFSFALALMPAIIGKQKPDFWTCGLTSVLLYVMSSVMLTLDLWLSAGSSLLLACMWTVLWLQERE